MLNAQIHSNAHNAISPTFYEQLLRLKIPKVQKKSIKLSSFIALLRSAHVKAARRMLVKLTLVILFSPLFPLTQFMH